MQNENPMLERAIKYATSQAMRANDVTDLTHVVRTTALVYAAQGLIDNGGLEYLFEADFPNRPSYSLFVDAYSTIGAHSEAAAIEQAVGLFPFADPHLHVDRRNKFMDSFRSGSNKSVDTPFEPLNEILSGSRRVWDCLNQYVLKNLQSLGGGEELS